MSFIHRFIGTENNYRWEDVPVREYGEEFLGVTRQIMIGPDDGSNNFHLRYFRLEPGSHSHLEHHPHEHGVIILHGKARVQLNDEFFEVKPYDAIFISSEDVHQFTPIGDEPLGFLCVIKDKNSK
ncbi:cupin domain-containing protein [Pelolinea submarina]|jgi:quercetin dioxygenase-like cupin family protein|uniref:Quercetin dioxygenase-like cupin family protein n=1 Tax=Pelolinea submarina TaxID=913107 RepID=A0A347ZS74_9CHLR|nr:cupin domain-containing protein [Pelolinea submarina]REG11280.1 quercetin dioxygenase-like cupin family protein [Pelolinea submarina]BBB48155.1 ribulose-bisphosphate carboxylase large chain [Pelolinea submarina]